jgi:hypothetical protein
MFCTYSPFAHIAWLLVANTTLSAQPHRYRSSSHNTVWRRDNYNDFFFSRHRLNTISSSPFIYKWLFPAVNSMKVTIRPPWRPHLRLKHDVLVCDTMASSVMRVRGARSQVTPVRGKHLGFWINIFSNLPVITAHFYKCKNSISNKQI